MITRVCSFFALISCMFASMFFSCVYAFDFDTYIVDEPYDDLFNEPSIGNASIDVGATLEGEVTDPDGVLLKLLDVFGISFDGDEQKAFAYIRNIINYLLVIIGLIAMIVLVFGFYQVFSADGEEGVTQARKIITGAAIALFIIGLARFITSFAFDLFYTSTEGI